MDSVQVKICAMVALGAGSMIVGMLPAWLYRRRSQRETLEGGSLLRSVLLCFGGGVLLATSILHMLPEARESLPRYADISYCAGFFLIYIIDELVHMLYGRGTNDANNSNSLTHDGHRHSHSHSHSHSHGHSHEETHHNNSQTYGAVESTSLLIGTQPVAGGCHSVQQEPCTENSVGRGGLLIALSTHAILEGLAIGLEIQPAKVLLLLGAVASHKLVFGFCLGTELKASQTITLFKYILAIATFSLGSVFGIGVGMLLEESNEYWTQTALGMMQALAGGTLLYVTLSEVLPRERARWHDGNRMAGISQFFAVLIGFLLIYVINKYIDGDSDENYIN